MRSALKLELKRALRNKWFFIAICTATAIGLINVGYMAYNHYDTVVRIAEMQEYLGAEADPVVHAYSLFNSWIGADISTIAYSVFYLAFPLFATFAYGWSYCADKNSGYIKSIAAKGCKKQYIFSKYIAVFTAGGLAAAIPLLFNFLANALFLPAVQPDIMYLSSYGVMQKHLWSSLFYSNPFVFVFLYLLLNFVFCGLIATISLALSYFINNKFAVVLIPYFALLMLHFSRNLISIETEISPLYLLHATTVEYAADGFVVLVEGLVIFLFTFGLTIWKCMKDEVF